MEYDETMYNSICRVCLLHSDSDNMVSLTDDSTKDGLSYYGNAVAIITNIPLKNDSLPRKMCSKCLHLLKQAIVFRKTCESSHEKLTRFMRNSLRSDPNFKEKLCDYVAFVDSFPEEAILKSPNKSSVRKTQKKRDEKEKVLLRRQCNIIEDCSSDTDYDDLFSDNWTNQPSVNPEMDDDIDSILHKMELISDIKPSTSQLNNKYNTVLLKNECNKSEDFDNDKIYLDFSDLFFDNLKTEPNFNTDNKDNLDKLLDNMEVISELKPGSLQVYQKRYTKNKQINKNVTYTKQKRKRTKQQSKVKDLQCKICMKVLSNLSSYQAHSQRHSGGRYICEQCGRKFVTYAELQYHLASTHNIGLQFICKECGFKAPKKHELMEHERLHTGERPYACDKCGLTFRRRYIWKKHALYHMERTIECQLCPRKFHQRSELIAHMNGVHERMYIYACSHCDVTYAKTGTVRRHMTDKHGIARELQGKVRRINLGKTSSILQSVKGRSSFPNTT